jgi:hypothetical protein
VQNYSKNPWLQASACGDSFAVGTGSDVSAGGLPLHVRQLIGQQALQQLVKFAFAR